MPIHILPNGLQLQFSEQDRCLIAAYTWKAGKDLYVRAYVRGSKPQHWVFFHRKVLNAPDELEVDHIDGNPLNNYRENLRLVSRSQNMYNRGADTFDGRTAKFKGVSLCNKTGKWRARINTSTGELWLGYYPTQELAALAYNSAARILHKEHTKLNEITI